METMQPLEKRIHSDCEAALRRRDDRVVLTLRMLIAALQTRQIEKRGKGDAGPMSDEETLDAIIREVKKRKESAQAFREGGRMDLAEKEEAESLILGAYLPPQATEDEIKEAIQKAVALVAPSSKKDFGKVMGEAMKSLKGRADAGAVGAKIKEIFSSLA